MYRYTVIPSLLLTAFVVVGCSKSDAGLSRQDSAGEAKKLTKNDAGSANDAITVPKNADILGIRSGMTPDEARNILKKRFPSVTIEEHNYDQKDGTTNQHVAIMVADSGAKGPKGFDESVFVRFTQTTGKVYYIKREVNRAAPSNSYQQAILEKYGKDYYQVPNKIVMQWNWDNHGKRMMNDLGGFCAADFQRFIPSAVERSCGVGISAFIAGSQTGDAEGMRIALIDSSVLTEEINAVKEARLNDPKAAALKPAM